MRLPSKILTEAHRLNEQASAHSNRTSNDNEVVHFANVLTQRGLPVMVLAPGKSNGVDKLLAWLVGDDKPLDT